MILLAVTGTSSPSSSAALLSAAHRLGGSVKKLARGFCGQVKRHKVQDRDLVEQVHSSISWARRVVVSVNEALHLLRWARQAPHGRVVGSFHPSPSTLYLAPSLGLCTLLEDLLLDLRDDDDLGFLLVVVMVAEPSGGAGGRDFARSAAFFLFSSRIKSDTSLTCVSRVSFPESKMFRTCLRKLLKSSGLDSRKASTRWR